MFAAFRTFRTVHSCTAALALLAGAAASFGQCDSNKLTASDPSSYDGFSNSVAVSTTASGPIAIIAAATDDTAEGNAAGSVYAFTRTNGVWSQTAHFFPNDLNNEFYFGRAVAYADPYLIVGADGVDAPEGSDCGAFYMYERSGNSWISKGRYIPFYAADHSHTGWAVDITTSNGGRAIIGAPDTDWDGSAAAGMQNPHSGTAYIYERLGDGTWGYVQAIWDYDSTGDSAYQYLGQAVAIDGNLAVVAAPNGRAPGKPNLSGYIKVFRRTNNGWVAMGDSRISPADAQDTDLFGYSVDTDGSYVVVGSLNHDSTAAQTPAQGATFTTGCVYVYKWNTSTNQLDLDGQLFADDAVSGLQMGGTVKIAGGKVYASSYSNHKVYCFKRLGANNWVQELVFNDPEPTNSSFAGDFAIAGDAMIVADASDTRGALLTTGAAFAFTLDNNTDAGNDSCDGAKVVQAGNHTGCTTGSTYSIGATCGTGGATGPAGDVWYSWTPACSGNIIIDTIGSNYDTVLSVHSACPEIGNSHVIACNDDASAPYSPDSLVTFNFSAGTTYLIRVGGYNGQTGNYVLRINDYAPAPSNNNCTSPTVVPTQGGVYTWANCKATTDGPTSATSCGLRMINDVWFRYTAPVNGTLKMDTCGSNYDTMIGLFVSGVGCPSSIQEIGCNDDAPANSPCPSQVRTSYLTHAVLAGQSYMIRVGGYDTTTPVGDAILTVDFDASCPCDWNLSGLVSVQDIFDFLASYFAGNGDFNQSGATTVQDIFDFLSCYFGGCQ